MGKERDEERENEGGRREEEGGSKVSLGLSPELQSGQGRGKVLAVTTGNGRICWMK